MSVPSQSCFLKTLQSRREYYQLLLDLSLRQTDLIRTDNYIQLLEVLAQKQSLLQDMDGLRQSLPDLWQQWHSKRDTLDPLSRNVCERMLAESKVILEEVMKNEQDSTDLLTQCRDYTRKNLQAIAEGTQVHEAYRDSLAPVKYRHLDIDQ